MKLHAKSHIRFIRTETIHCFLPCDSLDWKLHIDTKNLFEQIGKISLIYIDYIINIYERKLHIDLCELRLTVSTKVLITETSCDLDITVKSGAHQKLFVQLRRLWKSVEASRMNTGWYQVVSGSLRSTLSKHRCLDLKKSLVCEELSCKLSNLALHHDVSLKIRSS